MNEREDKLGKILKKGGSIAGSVAGAVLGSAVTPVIGTAAGAVAGAASSSVITVLMEEVSDFVSRQLSDREQIRLGASVDDMKNKIQQYLGEGKQLRQDGFFNENVNKRSKAKEIFEGILTKVKSQYQEKKIKLFSNLYANSAFREDVSTTELYSLMRIIDELDYEDILLLASILSFCNDHNENSEKIGFIFPSNSAITDQRSQTKQAGFLSSHNPIEILRTIHPIPSNNIDFYYFHGRLNKLSNLKLIGGFCNLDSIKIENIPQEILDKYGQQEYSVFYYSFTSENLKLVSRYNDLLEFSTIAENELIHTRNHLFSGKHCPSNYQVHKDNYG